MEFNLIPFNDDEKKQIREGVLLSLIIIVLFISITCYFKIWAFQQ